MKIRILKRLVDGVFEVRVQTEDWSEHDKDMMVKYGEPEINLGGMFPCDASSSTESSSCGFRLDDRYVRIMSESPFTSKFDSRDFAGKIEEARIVMATWISEIEQRITTSVEQLRDAGSVFTTEEITEV